MTLLNIFHTGGLTGTLTAVWLILAGWFFYQAYKGHTSGWYQVNPQTGVRSEGKEKTPYWTNPMFWFGVVVTALYIFALFQINSDFKGV